MSSWAELLRRSSASTPKALGVLPACAMASEPEQEAVATPTTFELELLLPKRPLLPKNVEALGLPETPSPLRVAVSQHEMLNDLRATLNDSPEAVSYTHLTLPTSELK